ncbi:hypothetical protein [Cetobacterium sp.]|uniref:hypothetical protein n=1 Tax=Cetobacterium sp. TaxID=2071632 RepID=UPI003F39276F
MSKIKELNLIPQYIKDKKANKEKIKGIILGGVIFCCAIGSVVVYLNVKISKLENKKIILMKELQKTQERFNENQELNSNIRSLEGKISKINSLSVIKDRDTKAIIANLSEKFPQGLKVNLFEFATTEEDVKNGLLGNITMNGEAEKRSEIEELWANLREDKRYYTAHISEIKEVDSEETKVKSYMFKIVLKIKEK